MGYYRNIFQLFPKKDPRHDYGGNNGTLSSGATYASDVPSVLAGNIFSMNFDGTSNGKVTLASSISFNNGLSVGFRFKANSWGSGGVILSSDSNSTGRVMVDSTGVIIRSNQYPSMETFTLSSSLSLNTWYSVVIVRVSSYVFVWLYNSSGSLITSNSAYPPMTQDLTVNKIGSYYDGSNTTYNFDGKICDVQFWNARLDSTSDQTNYGAGLSTTVNSSIHLKMNEGSGSTAWDYII